MVLRTRDLRPDDRPWVRALVERHFGLPLVSPSGLHDAPETYDGVVGDADGARAGVVTFVRDGDEWEIVTLIAARDGIGVGRRLLAAVRQLAEVAGATRVWLITTDGGGATTFYERLGMTRVRTLDGFVEVVGRVKPSVEGFRDAYEYEWRIR
jgi:GNAT superfamily N-acetyltransferase